MCVNYTPTRHEKLAYFARTGKDLDDYWPETWQDYQAPIVKLDQEREREVVLASYGMVPQNHLPEGVRFSTMNARLETIAEKRSYARAWRLAQRCLVPMSAFFEPNYESGKAERWRIGVKAEGEHAAYPSDTATQAEFAVAGLYHSWQDPQGQLQFSFTQITINADQHPLMQRFHKPGDEKRSLVILPPEHYDDWLSDPQQEFARALLTLYPALNMWAEPAPLQRVSKAKASSRKAGPASSAADEAPANTAQQASLF